MLVIDWYRIVVDLQRCGMTIGAQARRAKIRYYVLYRRAWRQSGRTIDLPHAAGERLLRLWADTTLRDPVDAPTLPNCKHD